MRRYDQPSENQGMLTELDYRFPNNSGGVTLYEQTLRQFRSLDPTPHPSNNHPISHRPVARKLKDNSLNSTIKRGPNFQQGPPSKLSKEQLQHTSSTNRSIQKNISNYQNNNSLIDRNMKNRANYNSGQKHRSQL